MCQKPQLFQWLNSGILLARFNTRAYLQVWHRDYVQRRSHWEITHSLQSGQEMWSVRTGACHVTAGATRKGFYLPVGYRLLYTILGEARYSASWTIASFKVLVMGGGFPRKIPLAISGLWVMEQLYFHRACAPAHAHTPYTHKYFSKWVKWACVYFTIEHMFNLKKAFAVIKGSSMGIPCLSPLCMQASDLPSVFFLLKSFVFVYRDSVSQHLSKGGSSLCRGQDAARPLPRRPPLVTCSSWETPSVRKARFLLHLDLTMCWPTSAKTSSLWEES